MTPPRRFAAVVLDCDGVLVDSEPNCNRVFAEELARLGLQMPIGDVVATQGFRRPLPAAIAVGAAARGARSARHRCGARCPGRVRHSGGGGLERQPRKDADDARRHRPLAAARLAVEPHACLAVEDSPTGVRAAAAAGMTVLGYAAGESRDALLDAGATLCCAEMAEIARCITADRQQLNGS